MPFPFIWMGALVAGLVLVGALAAFGLALEAVTRVTTDFRGSILPGLVAGIREWDAEGGAAARSAADVSRSPARSPIEESAPLDGGSLERVHPHVQ
jgi:hypothetical protein